MKIFLVQCKWFDGSSDQWYTEMAYKDRTLAENTEKMLQQNVDKRLFENYYIEEVDFNEGAFL